MSLSDFQAPPSPEDMRENIKSKFLVEMPEDFYAFWNFAKKLSAKNPTSRNCCWELCTVMSSHRTTPIRISAAFESELGLKLVGPFDILAGKSKNCKRKACYLRHWRYFYDPPEFLTVVKGDDESQFHFGYFRYGHIINGLRITPEISNSWCSAFLYYLNCRDDPTEMPAFVGSNCAAKNGNISSHGENLFAAFVYVTTVLTWLNCFNVF